MSTEEVDRLDPSEWIADDVAANRDPTVVRDRQRYGGEGYGIGESVLVTDGATTVVKGLQASDVVDHALGPDGTIENLSPIGGRENVLAVGSEPFDEVFDGLDRAREAPGTLFTELAVPESRARAVEAVLDGGTADAEGVGLVDLFEEFDGAEVEALRESGFEASDVTAVGSGTEVGPATLYASGDGLGLTVDGAYHLAPDIDAATEASGVSDVSADVGIAVPPSFERDGRSTGRAGQTQTY